MAVNLPMYQARSEPNHPCLPYGFPPCNCIERRQEYVETLSLKEGLF
jgi:hypothetical protein